MLGLFIAGLVFALCFAHPLIGLAVAVVLFLIWEP